MNKLYTRSGISNGSLNFKPINFQFSRSPKFVLKDYYSKQHNLKGS